jgi:hypothetical protein
MKRRDLVNEKLQYRLVLCGHKAAEAGAVCMVLMVQGRLAEMGLVHVALATKTGLLAVSPALAVTFTRYAKHLVNRWTTSLFFGASTFFADALVHASHYPGEYTEAALTALGAFSLAISYTPVGKRIDHLAETFLFSTPLPTEEGEAAAERNVE